MSKTRSRAESKINRRPAAKQKGTSAELPHVLASKVTARSQTTLPSGVRKALGLRAGDRIVYVIEHDQVLIRKLQDDEEDPALLGFLDLLERDIERNKDRILFATEAFAEYLEELTAGIEVDYDAPIEGDYEL
jgi:antitoxin PrlF